MTNEDLLKAERERTSAIRAIGRNHNLAAEAERAENEGTSLADFTVFALKQVEARQLKIQAQPSVDLTPKEQKAYSFANAVRQVVKGTWGREGSLERDVHNEMTSLGMRASEERSILVPHELMGNAARATSIIGSGGTAQHLVPQTQLQFSPFLVSSLAFVRAGAVVLSGLRGEFDFPGGDALGTAGTPGENQTQSDSEATFRNVRATPKPVRSRSTFSKQLLNNGVPSVDALLERTLQKRVQIKMENQFYLGAGGASEMTGLDAKSGVSDVTFEDTAVSYANFLSMITAIDDAKAMLGNVSYISTMGVVTAGLTTYRNGTGSDRSVLSYLPGMQDQWMLDGYNFFRSHEVKKTYADPDSPSSLVAHAAYAGVFEYAYICLFGPAMDILVDPFTEAGKGSIVFWISQDADLALPIPEAFARTNDIVLG
jgi:HK97 family phage major capsid protein